ncbi:metallophosphoesterase [Flavobacterium sp. CBA20B-1]|uniref:metallophosphoesterase n=1 Tax=unclassified Flavobacterium TaxID=196869 RepID=UPI0022242C27|nr:MULTISPECIES: metallophosphoesterase [unclassified Flavobacterium]WCM41547.1 metallophosphoesterase [Flavobacterium sp. CBA20B-1]
MIKTILYLLLILVVLGEVYTCILIYRFTEKKIAVYAYLLLLAVIIVSIISYFKSFDRSAGQTAESMHVTALLLLFILPKLLISVPLFFEDIIRLFYWGYTKLFLAKSVTLLRSGTLLKIILPASLLLMASIIYGIVVGKYNFQVRKETIVFKDLPESFDGLKVLQISDLHVGSWDNKDAIEKGIKMINQQDYDVLLFTGDFVNTLASEADPWIRILQKIKTPKYGKFAVLGNHDYGEYVKWNSAAEKEANFVQIKNNITTSGFQLLLNENVVLKTETDSIYLLGVENWGLNFKKAGDLKKTSLNVPTDAFKIVMTHDPSHWNAEIVNHPQKYQLTLSGHTHGMQFGFKIPKVMEWSPATYVYPEWGGLYNKGHQYIYVNRGFGFHAYSGRVGIWPEITLLELKKSK